MQTYNEWLKRKGYKENSIKRYETSLKVFCRWYQETTNHSFTPKYLTSIDANDWQQYLMDEAKTKTGKPLAVSTVSNYIESIKTYFLYLYDTHQISYDFSKDIKSPKITKLKKAQWLDRKEKSIFLSYIDNPRLKEKNPWRYYRNLAICLSMLMAGLRISEVVRLNVTDIEDGFISIRNSKGHKSRIIPINKDLKVVFDNWLIERNQSLKTKQNALFLSQKGGRITVSTIRSLIDKIRSETNLPELTPHTLRHTFCYDLVSRGVPERQIADLAGHTDIKTTRIYTASKDQDYIKAVNLLSTGRYKYN